MPDDGFHFGCGSVIYFISNNKPKKAKIAARMRVDNWRDSYTPADTYQPFGAARIEYRTDEGDSVLEPEAFASAQELVAHIEGSLT